VFNIAPDALFKQVPTGQVALCFKLSFFSFEQYLMAYSLKSVNLQTCMIPQMADWSLDYLLCSTLSGHIQVCQTDLL